MYITKDDLNFLIDLETRLEAEFGFRDEDVQELYKLNDKLIKRCREQNEYTRQFVAERRKTDKNYARPKMKMKEI